MSNVNITIVTANPTGSTKTYTALKINGVLYGTASLGVAAWVNLKTVSVDSKDLCKAIVQSAKDDLLAVLREEMK